MHAERATCSPIAQIQGTVGAEKKDYYIKLKSTQRESCTADPKWRARGESLELRALINRGEVQACGSARRGHQLSCTMTCSSSSSVQEYAPVIMLFLSICASLFWRLCMFVVVFPLPALLFFSCVPDLVKCSRTAAWCTLLQLINWLWQHDLCYKFCT